MPRLLKKASLTINNEETARAIEFRPGPLLSVDRKCRTTAKMARLTQFSDIARSFSVPTFEARFLEISAGQPTPRRKVGRP
jgi:hypothetical protein